jgi:coenzyme F420-0:L-glutamate ligase / coenzyme F420-1:gamma-L-glutamate ligase
MTAIAPNEHGRVIRCDDRLTLTALRTFPLVGAGDDLATFVVEALRRESVELTDGDVLVVASKVVSRAEGRFVDLSTLGVSERARELGQRIGLDERVVELVLMDAVEISRVAPGVLIVKNQLGIVCANGGVDLSNARPLGQTAGDGPWAIRLPEDPDRSASALRDALEARSGAEIGVILSDSIGRPFRLGSVGAAIGLAGPPALWDQRGQTDIFGMPLEHTITAFADQIAAAADLVAGQAGERRGVVHVRGLHFPIAGDTAKALVRPAELDLYAAPKRDGA